jgi:hypothetical protein
MKKLKLLPVLAILIAVACATISARSKSQSTDCVVYTFNPQTGLCDVPLSGYMFTTSRGILEYDMASTPGPCQDQVIIAPCAAN